MADVIQPDAQSVRVGASSDIKGIPLPSGLMHKGNVHA